MREYLDISFFANLVSMLRADIDGAVWLADDEEEARFYERCAHDTARVVATPNAALRLLDLVDGRGIEGIVVSVRGDETPACARENVFRPSLGDVASLLLTSRGFDRAIADICGVPWLTACAKQVGSVLHRAVWIACVVGKLREARYDEKGSSFDSIDLAEVVQWETFEPAWDRLHSILSNAGLSSLALEQAHATSCGRDVRTTIRQCDGMDAVSVVAAATRFFRPRGIRPLRQTQPRDLMAVLRMF